MPRRLTACWTLRTRRPGENIGELASLTAAADMLTSGSDDAAQHLHRRFVPLEASLNTSATMLGQGGIRTADRVSFSSCVVGASCRSCVHDGWPALDCLNFIKNDIFVVSNFHSRF